MQTQKAWDIIKISRNANRLTCMDYIENVFEDFLELHGDRCFGDDAAMVCGMAHFQGQPVMIIAQNRGKGPEDTIRRNYGMSRPEGYRKSHRMMRMAEKFGLPVICLVDTPGAYMDVDSENRGQASAIAQNLVELMKLKVPVISIIIGQGGSGGALALAIADRLYMLRDSTYSILSPEGFSTILFKDVTRAKEAAEYMKMTAEDLFKLDAIDGIIDEADEGNWTDPERTYKSMTEHIATALSELKALDTDKLVEMRQLEYRGF